MARNAQQQYTVDRFPGIGGIAAAEKRRNEQARQREATRLASLAAARSAQIELASTYRKALRHPVEIAVFDAVLERFCTAEAVTVDGKRFGAVTVAVDGVTTDLEVAEYFAEGSKVLDHALKGAKWAKRALVQSGAEITAQREAEKAARETVSA